MSFRILPWAPPSCPSRSVYVLERPCNKGISRSDGLSSSAQFCRFPRPGVGKNVEKAMGKLTAWGHNPANPCITMCTRSQPVLVTFFETWFGTAAHPTALLAAHAVEQDGICRRCCRRDRNVAQTSVRSLGDRFAASSMSRISTMRLSNTGASPPTKPARHISS